MGICGSKQAESLASGNRATITEAPVKQQKQELSRPRATSRINAVFTPEVGSDKAVTATHDTRTFRRPQAGGRAGIQDLFPIAFKVKPEENIQLLDEPQREAIRCLKGSYANIATALSVSTWMVKGARDYQEDRITVAVRPSTAPEVSFLAVYDGHGGSGVSQFLRQNLHVVFFERFRPGMTVPQVRSLLFEVFADVDRELMENEDVRHWLMLRSRKRLRFICPRCGLALPFCL